MASYKGFFKVLFQGSFEAVLGVPLTFSFEGSLKGCLKVLFPEGLGFRV